MLSIREPITVGNLTIRNRLYRAPALEGAASSKNPAKVYAKHFVPNAESGVGLIIQGNTIVTPEGRTSPGMTCVKDKEDILSLRTMTEKVRKAGAEIVIQLGHGGPFSLESWHAESRGKRMSKPWAPSAT